MKVLVVTQYYPPEPVPIPAEVAREMAQRGHSVRVVTGFPNYPSGNVLPGYRQRWRDRERDEAVSVVRVPLFVDHSQSALRRVLNYLSFAVSSATARRASRGADVIYVYATQLSAAFGPWLWRLTGGRPYILHVQDLWPDSIVGSSMVKTGALSALVEKVVVAWSRSVYRRAAGVVGIAPSMVAILRERGAGTAELVYNWGDPAAAPVPASSDDAPTTEILYAGNVGDMQDLQVAVRAAHAAADSGVRLTIVGNGVGLPRLQALASELGCTNVVFREPVPRDQMGGVYAKADFGLVSLKDLPLFRATIPSKFQGVLAYGVPVIATVQGDVRGFIEREGVGLAADASNVGSLEAAFRGAASMNAADRAAMRSRCASVYAANFDRNIGLSRLEAILTRAAGLDTASRRNDE